MEISAQAVRELRERTGAGMMDCKKALVEANGDFEEAVKVLRTRGLAAAAKKAHRAASEGAVVVEGNASRMAMLELNCETDFVARNNDFRTLAGALVRHALASGVGDVATLKGTVVGPSNQTVEQAVVAGIATIGENLVLSRVALVEAGDGHRLSSYVHMGGKIGVVVEGAGPVTEESLHDVALHIAATDPRYVSRVEVTDQILATEREIALQQAMSQGKPENIARKIVDGKMEKFFAEQVLLEQPFAKDQQVTVAEYLRASCGEGATVVRFVRFRLGEAVEE